MKCEAQQLDPRRATGVPASVSVVHGVTGDSVKRMPTLLTRSLPRAIRPARVRAYVWFDRPGTGGIPVGAYYT
jgi:hypothetical protein